MGCYKYPREVNWLTGVVLLFLTLGMGFTGQLLRWDQNAVWSVMVGAQQAGRAPFIGDALAYFILGGQTIGGATLSRFFAVHVFFIPAAVFVIVAIHLYLVVHDGISEPPVAGEPVDPATYRSRYERLIKERGVAFWPDVAWRDAVAALVVVACVVLLAWIVGPPNLGPPPDPSALARDPRPDWYLVWYYAVLALSPHGLTTWVILLAPLIGILVLICVPFVSNRGERHPLRRPWAVGAVLMIVMMIATLWIEGMRAPWSPDLDAKPLPAHVVGATSGPLAAAAILFHDRGCEFCHQIEGYGGRRGPDLSYIGDRLSKSDIVIRIMNGGYDMPAYAGVLTPEEVEDLSLFLSARKRGYSAAAR
ncbi:MAG: cytochrome b N-terminal domain-containing protein, partial [Candidatus Binataceae bacterium]